MAEEEGQEVIFVGPVASWKINGSTAAGNDPRLHTVMGAAYLSGLPKARVTFREFGRPVELMYDFLLMKQVNLSTGEEVDIIPPVGLVPPDNPCVPPGPAAFIMAPPTSIGKTVKVEHPLATGQFVTVSVPDRPFTTPPLSLASYSYHVDLAHHDWLWMLVPLLDIERLEEKTLDSVDQDALMEEDDLIELIDLQIFKPSGDLLGRVRCSVGETISDLKARLQMAEGVQAQVLHESTVLADDETLQLAGIQSGASLTLLYHDPVLQLLPFQFRKSSSSQPRSRMWMMAEIAEALPGDLVYPGVHIPLNNYTGSVTDSDIWDEAGDIGVFTENMEALGSQFLTGMSASRHDAESIVAFLQGDPHSVFKIYDCDMLLSDQCCQQLRNLLDSQCCKQKDVQITLSWNDLGAVVGQSSLASLVELFSDRVDQIKLRRVAAHGELINFHLDWSQKTMQVMLNDEDEYLGGRLAYLTSEGLQIPHRPRGCATIHDNTMVHGVTRMESGVRYSLFLQKMCA